MDENAELEILEAIDAGEISKEEGLGLLKEIEVSGSHLPVVNEMHPDIDLTTRALYKNFAAGGNQRDPTAANFLKKRHPELIFSKDSDGAILAKKPDDKEWRRLDPDNSSFQDLSFGEVLKDTGDVGYDILAAIGEGAASVAGGIGGAIAGLPTGPGAAVTGLAGGAAAGAAAGGGFEALRQGIGNALDVREGMDTDEIATSAIIGGVSPLLLGTGAGVKQIAKQGLKGGLSDQAQKQVLNAQRGLGSRALGKVGAKTGQLVSGIDSGILEYARQNLGAIRKAEDSGNAGAEIYGELRNKIETKVSDRLQESGEKLARLSDDAGITVDTSVAEKPLQDLLAAYEAKALKAVDKFGKEDAVYKKDFIKFSQLHNTLEPYLPVDPYNLPKTDGVLRGGEIKDYLDNLNEITGIAKNQSTDMLQGVKKDLQRVSRNAASKVDKMASKGPAGKVWKAEKKEYAVLKSISKDIGDKFFKDDFTTERTLNNLLSRKGKAKKLAINKALDKIGVDVDVEAEKSIANSLFIDPALDPQSIGGTTSTSRSNALGGFFGMLAGGGNSRLAAPAYFLGNKLGSPYAMRKAMEADKLVSNAVQGINNQPILGAPPVQSAANFWLLQNQREQ